ncbi:MAG: hypothetical protein COA78_16505 [Blastopirellula sp.]|nr:MAG: hypothetical protein COA78_16505 [Blastopirellula sp.]
MKPSALLCGLFFAIYLVFANLSLYAEQDSLPSLSGRSAPQTYDELWAGYNPQTEPLDVEVLHQWEEDDVLMKVLRFRVGIFKGQKAMIAAVYGYPKGQKNLPGLVQIHGGGQYADAKACIANARRGYATISIAWAGRISSSEYHVNPAGVKLYWDGKIDDPNYRITTDWGAVDGYHAPSRNAGNQFPSVKAADWTLDSVESPRNSGWFLCATAARRALTFLEQQPEVDNTRLGVYGHSMGGKLTVMTATDSRVKAAAPSCGGISDRYNDSELFRKTLGDDVSLKEISCPIIFLSPANDFHGRIVDLPQAINEIQSENWRITCSPHHGHQDTPPFEVATLLWFDQHLKNKFTMPSAPEATLQLKRGGVPSLQFTVDQSMPVQSIDVFYTQHGKANETPTDRKLSKTRFWHHVKPTQIDGRWFAELPISSTEQPLLAYANVSYALEEPVSGAGYYYRTYTANSFNLSSLLSIAWSEEVASSGVKSTLKPTNSIETFDGEWEKQWFNYRPEKWSHSTYKLNDAKYEAPSGAKLAIEILSEEPNELVILIDDYAAVVLLDGRNEHQQVILSPDNFKNFSEESLKDWNSIKLLKLSPTERLKPGRGELDNPRIIGKTWRGAPPKFRNLHWTEAK